MEYCLIDEAPLSLAKKKTFFSHLLPHERTVCEVVVRSVLIESYIVSLVKFWTTDNKVGESAK